jgi:hypothetical protein
MWVLESCGTDFFVSRIPNVPSRKILNSPESRLSRQRKILKIFNRSNHLSSWSLCRGSTRSFFIVNKKKLHSNRIKKSFTRTHMQDKMMIKVNENILKELCNRSDRREESINRVPENPLYPEHEEDQGECFLFSDECIVRIISFILLARHYFWLCCIERIDVWEDAMSINLKQISLVQRKQIRVMKIFWVQVNYIAKMRMKTLSIEVFKITFQNIYLIVPKMVSRIILLTIVYLDPYSIQGSFHFYFKDPFGFNESMLTQKDNRQNINFV